MFDILDMLYKTDKLKHTFPPLKMRQFKKSNARRYDYKERELMTALGGNQEDTDFFGDASKAIQLTK